jgi:beta-phosphoglucomutase-like phosphatase (HAD superfamily)
VIDDSSSGIEAAKSAGMTVIGFTNKGKNTDLTEADYLIYEYKNMDWKMFQKH